MNEIKNIYNKGILDYYNNMPVVFCNSKINLNISLRTIRNGIPLRAMDIMGAGGFLISNYQKNWMSCLLMEKIWFYIIMIMI